MCLALLEIQTYKYKHEIKCLPRCDPYMVLMADIKAEPKASSPNACLTSIGYCAQGCSHLAAASSKTSSVG